VAFSELIPELLVPLRRPGVRHVFHLYVVRVLRRDELLRFLNERGIEAKIHYPIPIHMQKAASVLGYVGSFPRAKADAREIITLPSHPYLTDDEVGHVIKEVRKFWTR
jgi:dTDP-4-amino-4,6-dideoxygalactose transaminase